MFELADPIDSLAAPAQPAVQALASRPQAAEEELVTGYVTCRDGARLYYEHNGLQDQRAALVIVNNYFMTAVQWRQFVGDLRQKFPVVAYDLRNQGRSDAGGADLDIATHVEDLGDLLDGLGLPRATLLGTCIASLIVAEFALKYPERAEKLVLVGSVLNPLGYRQHDFLHKSLLSSLRLGGAQALFDHYYPLLYTSRTIQAWGTPGYLVSRTRFLENNPPEQLEKHLSSSVKMKFDCERLRQLPMPTLFVSGEDDFMTRPSVIALQVRRMRQASSAFIPNAGHNPYIESPAEFQNAVYSFMTAGGEA